MSQPDCCTIREARLADAPALRDIYAPYVEHTAITFEYTVPSVEEFAARMACVLNTYPYLVAKLPSPAPEAEDIVGYCYASTFKERAAYHHAVELSIYLRADMRRHGIGRLLYTKMETLLQRQGILNLNACVSFDVSGGHDPYLNNDSVSFHQRLGFKQCAHFTRCGYKFARWYDMVWLEKILAYPEKAPRFIAWPQLKAHLSI